MLDQQANELRIFGADGRHVRSVGRTGEGPGDYLRANGLLWMAPDTLVVVDQSGGRYSLLTAEGDFVRSVRRPHGWVGYAFSGSHRQGRILEKTELDDGRSAFVAVGLGESEGEAADTIVLPASAGPVAQPFCEVPPGPPELANGGLGSSWPETYIIGPQRGRYIGLGLVCA